VQIEPLRKDCVAVRLIINRTSLSPYGDISDYYYMYRTFSVAALSMEPAANRTQADAFHASFQAFSDNVLVPDCLLYVIALLNWTVYCIIVLVIEGAINQPFIMITIMIITHQI